MKWMFVGIAVVLTSVPGAYAQDLTDLLGDRPPEDRREGRVSSSYSVRPNRLDLRLSPRILPLVPHSPEADRGRGELGVRADLDLDFVCGKFDLKATFENLLGKEMREEFLEGMIGYLESELTGSAMELLCQAQPTLCTLMQNHNIAANLKLGYHYDRCQAIQSAVDRGTRSVYASALEDCLRQKQAAGMPMDQALNACRQASEVRGLDGNLDVEFDLGREILDLVGLAPGGLSPGARDLATKLTEDTKYGPSWSASKPNANAVISRHDALTQQYLDAWERALSGAPTEGGDAAPPDGGNETSSRPRTPQLEGLCPPGGPPITELEIDRLRLLPPEDQQVAVGSLASAAAFGHLTREIHEVERALEALAGLPSIEETQRRMLQDRMARLRKERQRLQETYASQGIYQEAYLAVKKLADRQYAARVHRDRARNTASRTAPARARAVEAFGARHVESPSHAAGTQRRPPSTAPIHCATTTSSFEYSIGSTGTQP